MSKNQLSDKSLNILDEIKVKALNNVLKQAGDRLNSFQKKVLETNKKQIKKNIQKRTNKIERDKAMQNNPFKELLKDYKIDKE